MILLGVLRNNCYFHYPFYHFDAFVGIILNFVLGRENYMLHYYSCRVFFYLHSATLKIRAVQSIFKKKCGILVGWFVIYIWTNPYL